MDFIEKLFIRLGEQKTLAKIFWVLSLIASQLLFLVLISYVGNENHILGEVGYRISLFLITNLFGLSAFAFPLGWFYLSFQVLKNEKNISVIIRHLFGFMGVMFWFNVFLLNTVFINTAWAGLLPKLFHAIILRGLGGYYEFSIWVVGLEGFVFSAMLLLLVRSYLNMPMKDLLISIKTKIQKIFALLSKSTIMNKKNPEVASVSANQTTLGFAAQTRAWVVTPLKKIKNFFQTDWFGFVNRVDEQEFFKYLGDKAPQLSVGGFSLIKIDHGFYDQLNQYQPSSENLHKQSSTDFTTSIAEREETQNAQVDELDKNSEVIPIAFFLSEDDEASEEVSSAKSEIIDISLGKFFSGINGNSTEIFGDNQTTQVTMPNQEGRDNISVTEQNIPAVTAVAKNEPQTVTEIVPSVINKKLGKNKNSLKDIAFDPCLANSDKLVFSKNPIRSKTLDLEIKNTANKLEKTIQEFSIKTQVVNVSQGPVITQYELTLEPGVHINKIVSLSDNIALSLAAESIRIVAPIPGKAVIGVEIPNKLREMVTLRDITAKEVFASSKANLPIALGASISGEPVITDLTATPHLLVAGATGSGKSVCVNSIICSLLLKCSPEQVRFIMIDPKMVELNIYNGIPHLLSPVITDSSKAALTLKWAIAEMEARYRLLERFGVRSISSYNRMVEKNKDQKFEYGTLPYIVIIIDEFADLMMVAKKEVEDSVSRLAAMSRAIGIHLLLATQRPSVDVITGVIKANFPSRIAFQVSSKIDSRTIIDSMGAEKLLGKGDMLFQNAASGNPHRIQGTFLSDEEVKEIVSDLKTKRETDYILTLNDEINNNAENNPEFQDEVFQAALEIAKKEGKVSTSFLQRRLRIGYNRAARVVEMMEELGIVGASDGVKPREVLVSNF